ncbi:MAG: PAS domain-containing protein [Methylobacterium mesophilicum]|nr:PAS domain-containing protein [Methylobacterium mesophilicum]
MDTAGDADFETLAALVADALGTPIAVVSVMGDSRQWFSACFGAELRETPIETSFCAHTLALGDFLVVPDTHQDNRFRDNPFVTGEPHVRFYVGLPVVVDGFRIGTVAGYAFEPRPGPDDASRERLRRLGLLASSLFSLKHASRSGAIASLALAREEKRRGIALEAAGLASWVWDLRHHTIECDPLLPVLFGLAPATEIRARTLFATIDRRDLRLSRARFREAITTSGEYSGEYRIRDTDPPRWLAARGRVVEHDENGQPLLVFGVNFDVTERKAGDERQRLLLREINHRVKNTLATVQALASQTVRHARKPREFLEAFSGRLQALGLAHNLLSDQEWRGIAMRDLIRLEVGPFDDAAKPRIRLDGPDLVLPPDQALGLGLILHELASNALKYGALSVPRGHVDFSWRLAAPDALRLDWTETGGPAVHEPTQHGFGSILIRRSLGKVLGSHVEHEFLPEGVRASITLPLTPEQG